MSNEDGSGEHLEAHWRAAIQKQIPRIKNHRTSFGTHLEEYAASRLGSGNWDAFPVDRIPDVRAAAQHWAAKLEGISKPWLCWCVSDQWCMLQQRLVQLTGWTPIIGHDTSIQQPVILPGSVYVDFNAPLHLPRLYPHFVLEWTFLFADRLAFWHSDLLLSVKDMLKAARCFEDLRQGEIAMPWGASGMHPLKRPLHEVLARFGPVTNSHRVFEVIGCTTRQASQEQYEEGLGFWRQPEKHPNNRTLSPDFPHWEHSVGASLWVRRHPDRHRLPGVDIRTGHAISRRQIARRLPDSLRAELKGAKQAKLEEYEDLERFARRLHIEHLL